MVERVRVAIEALGRNPIPEVVRNQLHEIVVVLRFALLHRVETLVHQASHIELSVLVLSKVLLDRLVLAVFTESEAFYLVVHLHARCVVGMLLNEFLDHVVVLLRVENQLSSHSVQW